MFANCLFIFSLVVAECACDFAIVGFHHLRVDPSDADALVPEFFEGFAGLFAGRVQFVFRNRFIKLTEDEKVLQILLTHGSASGY